MASCWRSVIQFVCFLIQALVSLLTSGLRSRQTSSSLLEVDFVESRKRLLAMRRMCLGKRGPVVNLTLQSDSPVTSPIVHSESVLIHRRKSTMHSIAELTNEVGTRRTLHILTPEGAQLLDIGLVEAQFLQDICLPIHIRSILYHKEIQNALNNPGLPPLDVFRNGSAMLWSFLHHLVQVDVDNQHKLKLVQAVAEVSKGIIIGMVNRQAYFAVIKKLDRMSGSSGEFRDFISGASLSNSVQTGRRRSSIFQPCDVPDEFTEDAIPGGLDDALTRLRADTGNVNTLQFVVNFKTLKSHVQKYGADDGLPDLFSGLLPALARVLMAKDHDEKLTAEANAEIVKVLAGGLELQKYSISLDVFDFMVANGIRVLPDTMAYCIALGVLYRQSDNATPCGGVDPAVPDLKPIVT